MTATLLDVPPNRAVEPPPLPQVREARRERRLAAGFALFGLLVFGIAGSLDPYDPGGGPRPHGTHRQLGLPPCGLRSLTGVGCPSCGMTTSFSLLVHGDPVAAWRTNWAGVLIALLAALGTAWFLLVAAGLPPAGWTADEVVKWIVSVGMTTALIRWIVTVAVGTACRPS